MRIQQKIIEMKKGGGYPMGSFMVETLVTFTEMERMALIRYNMQPLTLLSRPNQPKHSEKKDGFDNLTVFHLINLSDGKVPDRYHCGTPRDAEELSDAIVDVLKQLKLKLDEEIATEERLAKKSGNELG